MFACMKLIHVTSVMLMELDNLVECPMLGVAHCPFSTSPSHVPAKGSIQIPTTHACPGRSIMHQAFGEGLWGKAGLTREITQRAAAHVGALGSTSDIEMVP